MRFQKTAKSARSYQRRLGIESLESRSLLATLPTGFDQTIVASGLVDPTTMTIAPDGRLIVAERTGALRVVTDTGLQAAPMGGIPSIPYGINGIVTDPAFETNGFLYVYYNYAANPIAINRLSRFQVDLNAPNLSLLPNSETILIDNIEGGEIDLHNGGFLAFGADGYLYLATGDGWKQEIVQSLDNLQGKVLRIAPANYPSIIPPTNPYVGVANARPEIWATGFRNPFSGAYNPANGDLFVNDVGSNLFEEVNRINAGGNFGWPLKEGIQLPAGAFENPLIAYPHDAVLGGSVTGGAFYNGVTFPGDYAGDYFFGDYTQGFIKRLDLATNQVTDFASGLITPVDLEMSPQGDLYWLSIGEGKVRKISYTQGNHAPEPQFDADPTSGLGPLTVVFNAIGSEDEDNDTLTYQWNFGDGTTGSGVLATHTYAENGSYSVVLTVSDGLAVRSTQPQLIVVGDTVPLVSILSPSVQSTFRSGDTISFSGDAVDRFGVALPASAFEWSIVQHHRSHIHPFIPTIPGVKSGTFTIPTTGEPDSVQFYRVILKVTNQTGLSSSRFVDILPETSPYTLATNVDGLQLLLDSSPLTLPKTIVGVEKMQRTVEAPLTQELNDNLYQFVRWSDDAPRVRTLEVPIDDGLTFTAIYQQLPQEALIESTPNPEWYMGERRAYSVNVTNLTAAVWPATAGPTGYSLVAYFEDPNVTGAIPANAVYTPLPSNVNAGGTVAVSASITAPSVPGNYILRHRVVRNDGQILRGKDSDPADVSRFNAIYTVIPPSTWIAGGAQTYSVTLTNNSGEEWLSTGLTPTRLAVYFGAANEASDFFPTNATAFDFPQPSVAIGQSVTFAITVPAPQTPGNYVLRHRMYRDNVAWFLPRTADSVTVQSLDASYTATIPETRSPGEAISYVLQLTNTGNAPWNAIGPQNVQVGVYFSGRSDNIGDWSQEPIRFQLPSDVLPGQSVSIPISLSAPTTAGTYTLRQRLVKENVRWFDSLLKTNFQIGTFSASYTATIPAEQPEATSKVIPVTLTNTGTLPWTSTSSEPMRLGYYFNAAGVTGAPSFANAVFLPVGTTVSVGGSITLNVPVTTPTLPGNYRLEFRLARGNFTWLNTAIGADIQVGTRRAAYVATVPADWWTAEQRSVSVNLTNTGTIPWNAAGTRPTRLGYYFVPDTQTGLPAISAGTFVALSANVAPGGTTTVTVPVIAPTLAGRYRLELRLEMGGEWFTSANVTNANVAGLTATYAGTVPTEWPAAATKTYTITVTNNSTRTWLAAGTDRVQLEAFFTGQTPVIVPLTANIAPGASVTLSVTMIAPTTAGSSTLTHRMMLASGTRFTTLLASTVTIGSLSATYVSTPPMVWQPGQTLTFITTVTNSGTSPWRMAGSNPTKLGIYFQGRSDAINDWVVAPQLVPLTRDVLPGESITLSVTTTAPTTAATYILRQRMVTENASWFTPLHKATVDVGTLNATYVSTPPSTWIAGQTQTFTLTVTNTGTAAWRASGANRVQLGVYFNGTSDAIGAWGSEPQRVAIPNDVLPGQSVTISVRATAPTTGGTYTLRLRMIAEGTAWFTALQKATVTVQTLSNSFVGVVPTAWTRNQLRTFSITLTNTGTATWNAAGTNPVKLAYYFDGRSDTIGDWVTEPIRITLPRDVLPGQSVTVSASVRAPLTAGSYTLRMRMVKENVAWFSSLSKTIVSVV